MTYSSVERVLKSDSGLQVERTTLSWIRTLFVSVLITLAIAKLLLDTHSIWLLMALFFAVVACIAINMSGIGVATLSISCKARRYCTIVVSLASSAIFYGLELFF
ncbi:DUF202 domain-containing protein [Vibrio sinensis]|uniref:DUF202 domain-containing protein n=1 Tax=Vibrio sinensis TaxID=2302434 RepID=A0A3A6RDR0_9VIBR|nr:DUF202 domain-containing protein [Vibrio sinensis]RJX75252.1 DUF202 domain-containing protein [Vibrio sinensis]